MARGCREKESKVVLSQIVTNNKKLEETKCIKS